MQRTFNYTRRKKIPKDLVVLTLTKVDDQTYFSASLKFDNLDMKPNGRIFIEAYYGPTSYRFDFGRVGQIRQPDDTNITELSRISDRFYFRLKIVDEGEGLILGYADKLDLVDDDKRSRATIFYVNTVRIETSEVWRMNFDSDSDGTPVLEINSAIEGVRDLARSDARFLALVYPAAIRSVLIRLTEEGNFDRDGEGWTSKWILFTQDVLGISSTPVNVDDEERLKEWYDDVVTAFCKRNRLLDQYIKSLS